MTVATSRATPRKRKASPTAPIGEPTLWYKDAVIYELHVRAFCDGNGDGVGDFQGLSSKLDYLKELGVTVIWLLPFYESPLRDDGYDIADYRRINPTYGTIRDFRNFLDKAHAMGLKVITELVLNHTSDQHAWFQRARRSPRGSKFRDYYVWSDTATEYSTARIIFKDFELSNWSWDPVAEQYFWHRFYSHQPDINFDSPAIKQEFFSIVDFWLEQGVDGFRLDAIPYLFERENTSCENLPETHAFLRELRAHVDANYPDRMLLAEANQWPDDSAHYFGDADECHMAYHFPLMPRLFMAVRMEDRFPITEILEQTPAIDDSCQWAIFLRNHDELTLEMVTDEERDYMYRAFARDDRARINLGIRRRLAPLLGNNRRLIELMNALLLSMKGTPVIYYGDELGMGDNIYLGDRNGVRTPMQWSSDRNAGFSSANPQRLFLPVIIDPEYHYEAINVDAQHANPSLLLWWMRRIIGLRKRHPAFGRGSMTFMDSDNRRVLAFVREHEGERILVVVNLSRFPQAVNLNLANYAGSQPNELFGQAKFPVITDAPYFLSLGPHNFFWFLLDAAPGQVASADERAGRPTITVPGRWHEVVEAKHRPALDAALANYLPNRRWFGGKSRRVRRLRLDEVIPIRRRAGVEAAFTTIQVEYQDGEPETYSLLLGAVDAGFAEQLDRDVPWATIARLETAQGSMLLVDASAIPSVTTTLLEHFRRRGRLDEDGGSLAFVPVPGRNRVTGELPPGAVSRSEQSNTSVIYGNRFMLKLLRRIEYGAHPQVEMDTRLAELGVAGSLTPRLTGTLVLEKGNRTAVAGILEDFVEHQVDAWQFTLDEFGRFAEDMAAERVPPPKLPRGVHPLDAGAVPAELTDRVGGWLAFARLLGSRTGELHAALATPSEKPEFATERFTPFYQRALSQGLRTRTRQALRQLKAELPRLSEADRALATRLLAVEDRILAVAAAFASKPFKGIRIRGHGDLHLGQVLIASGVPTFIDFEGEPARSLGERRVKRSTLLDVAGMLRSFHYASHLGLRPLAEANQAETVSGWAAAWYLWTAAAYLDGYFEATANTEALSDGGREERRLILDGLLLEKALYELSYEIDNRPDWVSVPMLGILELIEGGPEL